MVTQDKLKRSEDFVNSLLDLESAIADDYEDREMARKILDDYIFHLLVMIDGDSSVNDFKSVDLGFNDEVYLHEIFEGLRNK